MTDPTLAAALADYALATSSRAADGRSISMCAKTKSVCARRSPEPARGRALAAPLRVASRALVGRERRHSAVIHTPRFLRSREGVVYGRCVSVRRAAMKGGWSFPMIGKLAHVRSRRDVLIASLVITGVSVACAVVLTACATRSPEGGVDFNLLRVAAEIAAVITFVISFSVVDAIRGILKGKRSIERLAMTDDLTGSPNRRAFLAAAERAIAADRRRRPAAGVADRRSRPFQARQRRSTAIGPAIRRCRRRRRRSRGRCAATSISSAVSAARNSSCCSARPTKRRRAAPPKARERRSRRCAWRRPTAKSPSPPASATRRSSPATPFRRPCSAPTRRSTPPSGRGAIRSLRARRRRRSPRRRIDGRLRRDAPERLRRSA